MEKHREKGICLDGPHGALYITWTAVTTSAAVPEAIWGGHSIANILQYMLQDPKQARVVVLRWLVGGWKLRTVCFVSRAKPRIGHTGKSRPDQTTEEERQPNMVEGGQ